jgi:hypothetical protein
MNTARVSVTPECVIDPLVEKTLFQNQGVQTMLLAFNEEMTDGIFIEPWESITIPANDQPIWVCTPIAHIGYGSTLFWGPVLEEVP